MINIGILTTQPKTWFLNRWQWRLTSFLVFRTMEYPRLKLKYQRITKDCKKYSNYFLRFLISFCIFCIKDTKLQLKRYYILLKTIISSVKFQPSSFIPDCVDYVETITVIQMTIPRMNQVTKYNVNRTAESIYARHLVITGRFPATTVLQGKYRRNLHYK